MRYSVFDRLTALNHFQIIQKAALSLGKKSPASFPRHTQILASLSIPLSVLEINAISGKVENSYNLVVMGKALEKFSLTLFVMLQIYKNFTSCKTMIHLQKRQNNMPKYLPQLQNSGTIQQALKLPAHVHRPKICLRSLDDQA